MTWRVTAGQALAETASFARLSSMKSLAATAMAAAIAICAAAAPQSCKPEFPFLDGWWGGDGGYSVLLPTGETLWLFGDSFVGTTKNKSRSGTRMVNSTIGLASCDQDGKFHVRYVWARQGTRHPGAIFPPVGKEYKYWPMDGFTHGKDLYVALTMIKDRPDIPGAFNWEATGTRLARVRNVERPFTRWKIDYFDLYRGKVSLGESFVKDNGYVYLFSPADTGDAQHSPTFLTRFPESALDAPSLRIELEYLARNGSWKHIGPNGIALDDANHVMEDSFAANSVWYDSGRKHWIAVGQNPIFRSNEAVVRTAENLSGPWTAPSLLYRIPDADPAHGADKDTWCYSTLAHPEFKRADQILLTYACNTLGGVGRLINDLRIYFPRAVYVSPP
jgi:hypothetical protein